jgi:ribose transport system permease protein
VSTQSDLNPTAVTEAPAIERGGGNVALRLLSAVVEQILLIPWLGVLIGILLIGIYLSVTTSSFLTSDNILTTAQEFSYVGIAALGGAMVIMTRGIDLSVGANMALTGLVTADVLSHGAPTAVGILVGLLVGLGVGLVNAFLITVIGMQPFIATLGMLSVVRGAGLARSQGFTLYPPTSFTVYGQGKIGPVPNPVVIMIILTIILTIFLRNTALGRHIYAVGGNEDTARLLGIKVNWVKVVVYALAGVLGAIGGILLMSFLGSANPDAASGYELNVIAAAVIGGVSLFGGEGTLVGAVLGAALVQEIQNGLVLENVPGYWTELVVGLVILLAMAVDQARRRLRRGTAGGEGIVPFAATFGQTRRWLRRA